MDADGGPAEFALHEHKKPRAEVVGSEFGPAAECREPRAQAAEAMGVVFERKRRGVALHLHELQKLGFQRIRGVS